MPQFVICREVTEPALTRCLDSPAYLFCRGTGGCRAPMSATAGYGARLRQPSIPGHLLDARDHLVDSLLDRHLVSDDVVHGLRPDILVVQHGELVVLAHLVASDARRELIALGAAMGVAVPEGGFLGRGLDREPAAERAFDVGLEVFVAQQECHKLLGAVL